MELRMKGTVVAVFGAAIAFRQGSDQLPRAFRPHAASRYPALPFASPPAGAKDPGGLQQSKLPLARPLDGATLPGRGGLAHQVDADPSHYVRHARQGGAPILPARPLGEDLLQQAVADVCAGTPGRRPAPWPGSGPWPGGGPRGRRGADATPCIHAFRWPPECPAARGGPPPGFDLSGRGGFWPPPPVCSPGPGRSRTPARPGTAAGCCGRSFAVSAGRSVSSPSG